MALLELTLLCLVFIKCWNSLNPFQPNAICDALLKISLSAPFLKPNMGFIFKSLLIVNFSVGIIVPIPIFPDKKFKLPLISPPDVLIYILSWLCDKDALLFNSICILVFTASI